MLVIVDYKMGNLHSVKKKLDRLKIDALISSDPAVVLNATKLILPGVGHFGNAMKNLREMNLLDALNEAVLVKKTPILGICLGMQLMATKSRESRTESGEHGLGWFDAEVVKFSFADTLRFKVPHTGWNTISIEKETPIMTDIPENSEFYFVHSYYMKANDSKDVLNYTDYGTRFASAISKGNIYGFQYHPEKSHDVGMKLLENFCGFASLSHQFENPIQQFDNNSLTEAREGNDTEALEGNTNDAHIENKNASSVRPRVIPVLLLKGNVLVKSIGFKNPKYIGDPINAVKIYNDLKADELVFLDIEATKEKRLISLDFVKDVGEEANMPFAVGGGIRSLEDIRSIIAAGAEKVVINSYAVENPDFIAEAADTFGSSTIAICIDVKKKLFGGLQTWTMAGTKASGFSPVEFAQLMEEKGAGEIIIQSIEKDGEMNGYDISLVKQIAETVTIPVIALGGAGNMQHLKDGFEKGFANGLAGGSMFVYQGTKRGVLVTYPEKDEMIFDEKH